MSQSTDSRSRRGPASRERGHARRPPPPPDTRAAGPLLVRGETLDAPRALLPSTHGGTEKGQSHATGGQPTPDASRAPWTHVSWPQLSRPPCFTDCQSLEQRQPFPDSSLLEGEGTSGHARPSALRPGAARTQGCTHPRRGPRNGPRGRPHGVDSPSRPSRAFQGPKCVRAQRRYSNICY